jgi:flagellar biosynthesis chaperone FliJ
MKNSQLERRLSVMEARYNIDHARDEAAEVRRFLDMLSDQELNRCAEIAERSEAGISPTVEEQSFLDDLEAKYGPT